MKKFEKSFIKWHEGLFKYLIDFLKFFHSKSIEKLIFFQSLQKLGKKNEPFEKSLIKKHQRLFNFFSIFYGILIEKKI